MKLKHSEPYAPLRQQAYPAFGDQLDALMKLADALQQQGFVLPVETLEWVERCQSVKEKYKKPGENT